VPHRLECKSHSNPNTDAPLSWLGRLPSLFSGIVKAHQDRGRRWRSSFGSMKDSVNKVTAASNGTANCPMHSGGDRYSLGPYAGSLDTCVELPL
jgi:hypothetical protein